jgi:hypothetical protein
MSAKDGMTEMLMMAMSDCPALMSQLFVYKDFQT